MTYALDRNIVTTTASGVSSVQGVVASVKRLSTDEQLGLLWVIYDNMGRSITPAAPGSARLQFAEGLLNQIKAMPHQLQLQFMRDLVEKKNTPDTRAYGTLTNNTKLAFWFQLAEWMRTGEVIPVPRYYKLSASASSVFGAIAKLDFNQQITVLRQVVVDMGIDPLSI